MKFNLSFINVFFLSFILSGFSCRTNNKIDTENVVYYFPQKNVYYDEQVSKYYYSLDSARSWDSMVFKGAGYGAVLGPKVAVNRTSKSIWLNNETHRKTYNGVLLNIINRHTILLSKNDSIIKSKATVKIKPPPPVVIEKETPSEKGLKKFFNRLFGKKKKQAEEKNNKTTD